METTRSLLLGLLSPHVCSSPSPSASPSMSLGSGKEINIRSHDALKPCRLVSHKWHTKSKSGWVVLQTAESLAPFLYDLWKNNPFTVRMDEVTETNNSEKNPEVAAYETNSPGWTCYNQVQWGHTLWCMNQEVRAEKDSLHAACREAQAPCPQQGPSPTKEVRDFVYTDTRTCFAGEHILKHAHC